MLDENTCLVRQDSPQEREIAFNAEKHYNAKYIGAFDGGMLFYQPLPPKPEYSNVFCLQTQADPFTGQLNMFISSGDGVLNKTRYCIEVDTGTYLYSAHRHDFQQYNGFAVDGGREYLRYSAPPETQTSVFNLILANGELFVELNGKEYKVGEKNASE